MTELNESEIRKMPFFVTWHTMFLSLHFCIGTPEDHHNSIFYTPKVKITKIHIDVPEFSCAICIRFKWQITQDSSETTIWDLSDKFCKLSPKT
jgi:hypothetical protein